MCKLKEKKMELSLLRKELDNMIGNSDFLYLLILDCKYNAIKSDGYDAHAVQNFSKETVREVYVSRLKDFLRLDREILNKCLIYFKKYLSVNKKLNYTTIAVSSLKSILVKFLNGDIDNELQFVK